MPSPWCFTAQVDGCSGDGRPTCEAVECLIGAEPCPGGNHFRATGIACARTYCPSKGVVSPFSETSSVGLMEVSKGSMTALEAKMALTDLVGAPSLHSVCIDHIMPFGCPELNSARARIFSVSGLYVEPRKNANERSLWLREATIQGLKALRKKWGLAGEAIITHVGEVSRVQEKVSGKTWRWTGIPVWVFSPASAEAWLVIFNTEEVK